MSDCLATPLALASSWKSKGAVWRIVKDKGSGLIKPSAKNWKILMWAKQRSPGLCRYKAEARRRNHLSYTMIPPDTGCSPLCYCEAPKRIGLTMVSILAAMIP